ncbi:MAG: response regulator transcription factor [Pirellulaceae bacterium]|nr:response regulator transcription factor [Pirellulaceae bacterium]
MTKSSPTGKILIVDDHPSVRDGLSLRIGLHADLEVCGEADSEDAAYELVKQLSPDLVLIDISLKDGSGLELIKRIRSHNSAIKMLVVSGFQESLYAERACRAGAMGFLNKQESSAKLMEAIRTVLAGERFLSPAMTRRLVNQSLGMHDKSKSPIENLTNRELQIFRLIGEGLASGEIAERLLLSPYTIDTHRENIKRKLDIRNAAELSRTAVQWVLENGG